MTSGALANQLLTTALDLFRRRGYAEVTPHDVAVAAGCPAEDVFRHFPRKESFILALYGR